MPRPPRADEAFGIYHALNRGNLRATLFHKEADYVAFEKILGEALELYQIELLSYQLMPNHYHTQGLGHIYQQRFNSFPIQSDEHFLVVCRYVERNALRAGLVGQAEKWQWGSLYRWLQKPEPKPNLLSAWPVARLPNWIQRVNEALSEKELEAVRRYAYRGQPYGDEGWTESVARRMNLESTMRPRGRPKKGSLTKPNHKKET